MEDYSREQFIALLEKHFSKVEYDGNRYYLKGHKNKDVADALDYDDSQFGGILHGKSSYETPIRRLLKYEENKNLKSRLEGLTTEINEVRASRNRYKHMFFVAAAVAAFLGCTYLFQRSNSNVKLKSESVLQGSRLTGTQIRALLRWHGNHMRMLITHDVIIFYDNVKSGMYKDDFDYQWEQLINRTNNSLLESRQMLRDIQLLDRHGRNAVTYIEGSWNLENTRVKFNKIRPDIKGAKHSLREMSSRIIVQVAEAQNESLKAMKIDD